MKVTLLKKTFSSLTCLVFIPAGIFVLGTLAVPAQQSVNGLNVTEVQFGKNGIVYRTLKQVGNATWELFQDEADPIIRFRETGRDEWSVTLADQDGGTTTINLRLREVTKTYRGRTRLEGQVYRVASYPRLSANPPAYSFRPRISPDAPIVASKSQEPANGRNVTEVWFKNSMGNVTRFKQLDGKAWYKKNGGKSEHSVEERYNETARGQWSVYLTDPAGRSTVILNMWSEEVTEISGGQTKVLGKVFYANGRPTRRVSYSIQRVADGSFLRADGNGNTSLSPLRQPDDGYTKFILERQPDGSYCIKVNADGRYIRHVGNNKLVLTSYQPDDPYIRFILEPQPDGSYRMQLKGGYESYFGDDGGYVLINSGYQPDNNYAKSPKAGEDELSYSNEVEVSFVNQTNRLVTLFWVNKGNEIFYKILGHGETFRQPTNVHDRWRVRQDGRLIGTYVATSEYSQSVEITTRTLDAGSILNQKDAQTKCSRLAGNGGELWTGSWSTTFPAKTSLCTIYTMVPRRASSIVY